MHRTRGNQTRERAAPYHRTGNPDAPGAWKHDLHPGGSAPNNLAKRLSAQNGGPARGGSTLLGRISGADSQKGRELIVDPSSAASSKLHGYGATLPQAPPPNGGYELLPGNAERGADGGVKDPTYDQRHPGQGAGRGFGKFFTPALAAAGLEQAPVRERARRQVEAPVSSVNIRGLGKITVRVENLAQGTTAEDVQSAFAPSPIQSAKLSPNPSSNPDLVSIDLEYTDRAAAEELVKTYNGVVADGNALKVSILPGPPLAGRLGVSTGGLKSRLGEGASSAGKELVPPAKESKLYSDRILAVDTRTRIQQVADPEAAITASQRQDAWARSSGQPLSSRFGGGGRTGGRGMQAW